MSDSASFDNALEFFVRSGMSLPHAMAMMIPESFNEKNPICDKLKAFYEYHSILMEPWDGPAAMLFTDGRYAGGMLDRNGLRPARYLITDDGMLIMASEVGCIHVDASKVLELGKLKSGRKAPNDVPEFSRRLRAFDFTREELVMSLTEYIGAVGMNILTPSEGHCKMVRLPQPVLTNTELDTLCNIRYKGFNTEVLPIQSRSVSRLL